MPLEFVTVNDNVFQFLGDFVPQTLHTGAPPLDLACAVLKFPLKNPLTSMTT